MFSACEPIFLSGSNDFSIHYQSGSGVVVEGRDAENGRHELLVSGVAPRLVQNGSIVLEIASSVTVACLPGGAPV